MSSTQHTLHPDLFPETLLVDCHDGKVFTTSVKVAEHFHKSHRNVTRDIEKLVSDIADLGVSLLNFEQSDYQNERGKTYRMFRMDRKAFSVLAGRFTGKEALKWQLDFYDAFEAMEAELKRSTERFAKAYYQIRPCMQPVVQGTEQGLSRIEIAGPLGKSPAAVTYHRRQARRFGLLRSAEF